MREQPLSEDLLGASGQRPHQRRTIAIQVGRLIDRMTALVSLRSLRWQEPLRVLLTHPRPPTKLQEFHKCMRAACRSTRCDEQFVDFLNQAVVASALSHGPWDFLASIRLVLMACIGAMSPRPNVAMQAARQLIEEADLEKPLHLSFETQAETWASIEVLKADATATVATLVQHAVSTLLRAQSIGAEGFASWDEPEILAGMEALWLAYTYCSCGLADSGKLSANDLQFDWERCGAPLWRRLDAACRLAHPATSFEPYADKNLDAARLSLALSSAATSKATSSVPTADSADADSPTHIVCRTPIPSSSDKQDKDEIARHRVLETPLPVAHMPSLQAIEGSKAALLAEFPWAAETVEVIFDDLLGRANLGVRELTLPPTLLVGLPGAGKSRLARRIAEVLDLARLDISLAGTSDTKIIGGTSRGWATGRPSDLASLLARRGTASAVVLLDEIDKASESHREGGGICAYLLALLEPETASRHYDSFLKVECNFAKVSWVCTANVLSGIPKPLRSRLRILVVPQPQAQHFHIVSSGVIGELEERWQLPTGTLPPVDDLRIDWVGLASARQVRVATEASIGQWARTVIKH